MYSPIYIKEMSDIYVLYNAGTVDLKITLNFTFWLRNKRVSNVVWEKRTV